LQLSLRLQVLGASLNQRDLEIPWVKPGNRVALLQQLVIIDQRKLRGLDGLFS
jgi:hypothetical protein